MFDSMYTASHLLKISSYLLVLTGETERAEEILQSCIGFLHGQIRLGFRGYGVDDVRALVLLGETDKALDTLAEAVAAGWRNNWRSVFGLASFDEIRDDPRFVIQRKILNSDMAVQLESYLSVKPEH